MKGKSGAGSRAAERDDSAPIALEVLGRLIADPDRLGRFLALTGLDPSTIRAAAADPGFLASILDHVVEDEPLLVAIAGELGRSPESLARAQQRLSPPSDWSE